MSTETLSVAEYQALQKRPRKYKNRPVQKGEHKFASVAEATRFSQLKWLEHAGEIAELEVHPRFSLDVNGVHIGYYTGDAGYRTPTGYVCEDTKQPATRTTAYKLRKRLMKAIHGIEIREVG